MTFDEWESAHPPMQNESPNAYARRAFSAGVGGKGEAAAWRHSKTLCLYETEEEVPLADGDEWAEPLYAAPQAECAPRAAYGSGMIDAMEDFAPVPAPRAAEYADDGCQAAWDEMVRKGVERNTPERADAGKDATLTEARIEHEIEISGGYWVDGEFRIDCKDLMGLCRAILAANKEE